MKRNINIIAHRGDSFYYPENSGDSVINGYKNKTCNAIEIDVRMTKDQTLILNHEMRIYDRFNKNMLIKDYTWEEIQKKYQEAYRFDWLKHYIDVALSRDTIHDLYIYNKLKKLWNKKASFITLDKTLDMLPDTKSVFIEVKGKNKDYDDKKTYQKVLVNTIMPYRKKNLYIKSFYADTLHYLKEKLGNDVIIGILIQKKTSEYFKQTFDFYSIDFTLLWKYPELIDKYLITNTKTKTFYVWTIDTYKTYCQYLELFESYSYFPDIITNNPEIIYACHTIYMESKDYLDFKHKTEYWPIEDMIKYALKNT